MSDKLQLGASVELSGVLLTNRIASGDIATFKADPKAYAFQEANLDLQDTNLSVVENDDDTLHLALPYYSELENMASHAMEDEAMREAGGGEIWIGAIIASVVIGGAAGACVLGAFGDEIGNAK